MLDRHYANRTFQSKQNKNFKYNITIQRMARITNVAEDARLSIL